MANPNPFSPTTVGGRAGKAVYDELYEKEKRRDESRAKSNAAKYEANAKQKYDNNLIIIKALDEQVFPRLRIINDKKMEIASIMDDVFNSERGDASLINNVGIVTTDPLGSKISYIAGASTFEYDCVTEEKQTGYFKGGAIFGSVTNCKKGVRTEIFPDVFAALSFPNVESMNINVNSYRQGQEYVSVGNTNLGIGQVAGLYGDDGGVTDFVGIVTTANKSYGYYYYFPNLSAVSSSANDTISRLVNEIETLRTEINDYITNTTSGTNAIRKMKSDAQLKLWYEKKGQDADAVSYKANLASLENSETTTIIQNYDG